MVGLTSALGVLRPRMSVHASAWLGASVPARKTEREAFRPLLDDFFAGLGDKADAVLSANLGRAAKRLLDLVAEEQRRLTPKPDFDEVVQLLPFEPVRVTDRPISADRFGAFVRSAAYEGWKRSLFGVEWFDSTPERDLTNTIDEDEGVACWVRLHLKELPILWTTGREYNPDFLVIEADGSHLIVETKADKDMTSEVVLGKREAAERWANHVNADERVTGQWRYVLVSESDVATAKGSWAALKKLGG